MRKLLVLVSLVATPSMAQTPSPPTGPFVDVRLGADWDDTRSRNMPGAVWQSGVGFGIDLHGSGVEIDLTVPQAHVGTPPPQRYQFVGTSDPYEQQFHYYETSSVERRRSIEVMVLRRTSVAVGGRTTLTWLVGGGFVYRSYSDRTVIKEVAPDGQLNEVHASTYESSRNYLAASTGLDIEYRISPRLSVAPRLRVTIFPSLLDDSGLAPRLLNARPDVVVRWRF